MAEETTSRGQLNASIKRIRIEGEGACWEGYVDPTEPPRVNATQSPIGWSHIDPSVTVELPSMRGEALEILQHSQDDWRYSADGESISRDDLMRWLTQNDAHRKERGEPRARFALDGVTVEAPPPHEQTDSDTDAQDTEPDTPVFVRVSMGPFSFHESKLAEGWTRTIRHDGEGIKVNDVRNEES